MVASEAETLQRLELANRSRIVALPGANERSIRGYTPTTVIIDEAARVGDPLFYAALPMLSTTGGRLLLLSTAYAKQGFFYRIWTDGDPEWERHSVTGPECPHISGAVLREARQTMPDQWYRREWMCEFTDATDSFFGYDEVLHAISAEVLPIVLGGE